MSKPNVFVLLILFQTVQAGQAAYFELPCGEVLPGSSEQVKLWWASSGWKISPDKTAPETKGRAVVIRAARNEAEAAQLVIRPARAIPNVRIEATDLKGPAGVSIGAEALDVLRVRYVNVTTPTDKSSVKGLWPDPLPPLKRDVELKANRNNVFWVRVKVPRDAKAGTYRGDIKLTGQGFAAAAPLQVVVYDFVLADRMTCTTAFGFSVGNVYRYHGLKGSQQKRDVLEKYWANYSEHHISPYNPAPLDPIGVTWPDVKPPEPVWGGAVEVENERHAGRRALLIFDNRKDHSVTVSYRRLVKIPKNGFRLRFWYRTAVPEHACQVTLNHYDSAGKWIYGGNNDIGVEGNGQWQPFERVIKDFPKGAKSVRLNLRAAMWSEEGERTGLVWFDDVSLSDAVTGEELLEGGDFEIPSLPAVEQEKLGVKFDFSAWDRAMARAIDHYHFNSFRLGIAGMGGGTFHGRREPELRGFGEETPHYKAMFHSYCRQLQEHLREKGWLDEAFVYWFDEPAPKDYAFVMNGFAKLKAAAPDIRRMLTEQVEPALIGGPSIWCPVSHHYKHEPAEQRRQHGEKFWWYVCTGPKAPYCTLFIDHPGTELRVWLWQSWKYKIEGILVWQTNYWTSSAAYPDQPQNPYEDPMGWRSGYSTPKGEKRPWGNGDGRFVYPPEAAADANPDGPVLDGPVDSIRWEMLRDGIEDYEYLAMLRRLLASNRQKLSRQQYREYLGLLTVPESITVDMTHFTQDPAPIEARRDEIAQAIEALMRL